jgi:hypothetical protein
MKEEAIDRDVWRTRLGGRRKKEYMMIMKDYGKALVFESITRMIKTTKVNLSGR